MISIYRISFVGILKRGALHRNMDYALSATLQKICHHFKVEDTLISAIKFKGFKLHNTTTITYKSPSDRPTWILNIWRQNKKYSIRSHLQWSQKIKDYGIHKENRIQICDGTAAFLNLFCYTTKSVLNLCDIFKTDMTLQSKKLDSILEKTDLNWVKFI